VDEWPTEPPIGRPIGNMRAYVLDAGLQPVPAGVVGELYLAGAQLSRGYLNRPSFTASRYVANPFDGPGTRMYRTGDLVRWRRDGELVFAGRVDHQVKVRGFRIEPGEIEAVLRGHRDVEQVAVIAVEERPGVQRLVAYLVPASGPADPAELRRHAAAALPDYMVPSVFVQLERMPLSPNGKLDRKALPMPVRAAAGRPPGTPVEQALCEIYAEVLAAPPVSADDDFFALGGHSLSATKLMSRIRTVLRVEMPLRALFEHPTPAGLAGQVAVAGPARSALVPRPRPDLIPLSSAQLRLWFLDQMEGPSSTYNLPVVIRMHGMLDRDALQAAMGDVVARHESLRTVFPALAGRPYQRILNAVPRWEFDRIEESELAAAVEAAAGYAFDLASELPLALWLFEIGPAEHVLLVLMHHIAGDGWSMTPLTRDLATAYDCRLRGEPPGWPPLRVQYADYALWQRELLDGADLTYWSERLAGLPAEVALPFDRPRPAAPSYVGSRVPVRLDHEVHRGLAASATRTGSTLFMVLHAGLAVLLHRIGAGDDIPIGTVVAGRGDEKLDELVGFFVNTLVLRTDLAGDPTFDELLHQVRDNDIAAFSHQDVPFEHLVEVVNPSRRTGRHPLFQVMLAFNNNDEPSFGLTGLTASLEHLRRDIARFDLSVSLWEHSGPDGEPTGIDGYLQYSCDVFDHTAALAMADRLRRVFATVAAHPEVRIGTIDVYPVDSSPVAMPAPPDRDGGPAPDLGVPGSPQQRVLAEVFAEVLEVPEVGPHESFFELGGHSLLVVQLIARVQAVFGVRLTVRDVFEASTVAGLARRLTADSRADSLAVMLPLRTAGRGQPLFCVHPAAGTSWVYSGLLRFVDADRPIYGLQARGLREPERTPTSPREMVADYLAQLRAVQPHGPYALLGWSAGGLIAHLLAVRLQEEGEEVGFLAALDSYPRTADRHGTLAGPVLPDEIAASIGQDLAPAGLGELDTSTLVNVFTSTRALLADVPLGVFDGDLLLFEAVRDRPADSPYTAGLWRPHITGRISAHRVDCTHADMTTPGALDRIGPVLQAGLSASVASQRHHQQALATANNPSKE
jgi:thioesterase domain-containing protein/acyl carrier protein